MSSKTIDRRQQILHGNVFNIVISLALPVAINNMIIALYNMIDAFVISSKGTLSLSAVTFIDPITSFFYAISLAITVAATTIIARNIGKNNFENAKKNIIQTMILLGSVGLIISAFGFLFADDILRFLGATDRIIILAEGYFKIQMLIIPVKFMGDLFLGLQRAQGNNLKAMMINISSILIKVILSYYFIVVRDFGVIALAYSTLISFSVLALFGTYEIFLKKTLLKLSLREVKVNLKVLKPLTLISLPLIIEKTSLSFSHILVGNLTINYSETVLAAYGLTNKINSIMFSTATGFGVALVAIISQNLGNGNVERAKDTIKKTMFVALMISLLFLLATFAIRETLIPIFTRGDTELYRHTINAMNVYSVTVIPWTVFQIIIGVFQGSGHTSYSLIITICRVYIFRVPVIYILSNFTDLNEYSIWYGMLMANVLTAVLSIFLYYKVKWEKSPRILLKNNI